MNTEITDGEFVRRAQSGDLAGFTELYDRWFQRVYDYVLRMTRNPEDAADLTQDTFMRAMQKLDQLEEPEAFRGWLFAIARNQSLSRVKQRARTAPVAALPNEEQSEAANPLLSQIETDPSLDPSAAEAMQESADLVWEAASSLDERTYTVLDLHVRHGLQSAEIAEVLGTSKQNASMLINRMRSRVGDAVGTYLLMHKGSRSCDDLDQIVQRSDIPPVTRSDRRRVDRHVRSCGTCRTTKKGLVAPQHIFSALALVAAPAGLQAAIGDDLAEAWPEATSSPPPPGTGSSGRALLRPRVLVGLAVTAAGTAVLIFAAVQFANSGSEKISGDAPNSDLGTAAAVTETAEPEPAATEATTTSSSTEATPTAEPTRAEATTEATEEVTSAPTSPPPPPTPVPTPAPTTLAAPPTPEPTSPPEPTPPPVAEPTPPPPLPTPTEAPPNPAPAILSFTANPSPATCEGPFIELSWSTQNATGVSVSIDGPGVYDSYGPNGSASVPFACPEESHTYLLTAVGPEGSAEQTITVFKE